MQGRGGGRDAFSDFGDPFAGFGGFGSFGGHRSLLSGFLGGRDPFDDPFFRNPFGSMFDSSVFGSNASPFTNMPAAGFLEHQAPWSGQPRGPIMPAAGFLEHQAPRSSQPRGPIIEEINSDDEKEEEGTKQNKDNPRKHGRYSKEPYVEDLDDEAEERKSKHMQYWNAYNRVDNTQPQAHTFTFQSSSVTYGGSNGAYYSSSTTRRMGSDGLMFEESKEADTTTGQAAHRVSRGIHEKGHSLMRKLNSDGKVDTMQTLHNLNEDELAGFEHAWKGNARKHMPGWSERFNALENMGSSSSVQDRQASRGGWALPSTECPQPSGRMNPDVGVRIGSARSRMQHAAGRVKADARNRMGSHQGSEKPSG